MKITLSPTTSVDLQLVMTGRGCIIGQSGSGKSFLVGLIAEQLCKLKLPFCLIDTEGEYSPLKDYFKAIVIGGSKKDFGFDADLTKLFLSSIKDGVPTIIDLSEETGKDEKVYDALRKIYAIEDKLRTPYAVLIEEADKFVPQVVHQKINIIEELSVRGRKRGIGLIVATQRPSNISKNVLSQCSYGFIGKLTIENDLKAIKQLFKDRDALSEIVNLNMGEFVPFGIGSDNKFKVDTRKVTQRGSTPQVDMSSASAVDPEEFVKKLKGSQKDTAKKAHPKTDRQIKTLSIKFTMHDAHVYAKQTAKKRFVLFGKTVEVPESINLKYVGIGLCKIRTPTSRNHEFEEHIVLIDRSYRLLRLYKDVNFEDTGISKPIGMNDVDSKLLAEIRSRRKVKMSDIENYTFADIGDIKTSLRKLVAHKLLTRDEERVYSPDYRKYLIEDEPEVSAAYASKGQVSEEAIEKEQAIALIGNIYPNSSLVSFSVVYLPIYEITFRNKNKIRIFKIDGIYGKEISYGN